MLGFWRSWPLFCRRDAPVVLAVALLVPSGDLDRCEKLSVAVAPLAGSCCVAIVP